MLYIVLHRKTQEEIVSPYESLETSRGNQVKCEISWLYDDMGQGTTVAILGTFHSTAGTRESGTRPQNLSP